MSTPNIGKHSWDGSCDPRKADIRYHNLFKTFSVSCFEWIAASTRKGYKRGKTKVRIKGSFTNPDPVYRKAIQVCDQLDAGTYIGPKNITIVTYDQPNPQP